MSRSTAPAVGLFLLTVGGCSADPSTKPALEREDGDSAGPDEQVPLGDPVDLLSKVLPLSGTGGIGYNVGSGTPAAAVPVGLVMPGPDTSDAHGARFGAYRGGGYHYDDVHIDGFSQLHLHGVGLTSYGLLAWMPVDGMDASRTLREGRMAPFTHDDEQVSPGRYAVSLEDPDVDVVLATDGHAAQHRYTFGEAGSPALLLDLGHVLGTGEAFAGAVDFDPETGAVAGWLRQQGEMDKRPFTVWFDGVVSPLPAAHGVWAEADALQAGVASVEAENLDGELHAGLWLEFPPGTTVDLELAVSMTDAAGAVANRTGAALDPEGLAEAARERWADWLEPVRVWGGTPDEQAIFATSLYRSLLMPNAISDRDGRYRGFDDTVHDSPGHAVFSDMSLWDTYRTTHPLYTLLWPQMHGEALASLLLHAEQGGGIPRWPLGPWEGGFMVGSPGHIIAAEAVSKGIVGDWTEPLLAHAADEALGRVAPPYAGRPEPDAYAAKDWWSVDDIGRSVAWTQEVCLADHALGTALLDSGGNTADGEELLRRGGNWAALYNAETGWFQGRTADGEWVDLRSTDSWGDVYAEGNARQYVWMVPHDPAGLFEAMGGEDDVLVRLEEFFEQAAVDAVDDIVGVPEVYYWHGNEIDLHAPWLFALAGRPDLTRRWVNWVMQTWYSTGGDGLAGNDDGGTLSAWYVWAAMGLYPMAGTVDYVVGWPSFERVEVDRADGSTLVIRRTGDGLAEGAVVDVEVDGVALVGATLDHDLLASASEVHFVVR